MDLMEFAEQDNTKPGQRCKTCTQVPPEHLREAHAGYEGGLTRAVIARWLQSLGYNISVGNLERHFSARHPAP